MIEITGEYRELLKKFGLLHEWEKDILRRTAYIKTGVMEDSGILCTGKVGKEFYSYGVKTYIVPYECHDWDYPFRNFWYFGSGFDKEEIERKYEKARDAAHEANPFPGSLIDVRSLKQLQNGCCPKAIMAAMLKEIETA